MDEHKDKLIELIKKVKVGMLTTMTDEGEHHSRPMALQATEFDGDIWFFTYEQSKKISEINSNPSVNVAISESGNSWISIAGKAEVVHDHSKVEELWNPLLKAWFEDGVDTKGLTLIKVHASSAEYWDSPNSGVIQLLGTAKAAITGQRSQGGENESVDL